MSHARQQIRDQAKTTLTGLSTTGTNVFKFRVYPMAAASLPGLIIYTKEEESERSGDGLIRVLSLAVEGYAQATADVEDTLDDMAEEVEAAIDADPHLNGLAKDAILLSTEFDLTGEGKKQVGVITLIFNILYKT